MKVSLTCKLDSAGAYGFIKPISDSNLITEVNVFRDDKALSYTKTRYHVSFNKRNGLLSQAHKFLKMCKIVDEKFTLSIGIYEIPHGVLAFFIGLLKKIPTVISIIGNPGYEKLRKGLRKKITYFMYRRIYAVTVTGTNSKEVLVKNGIDLNKIFILPNSININLFSPNKSAIKKYEIISLGYLSKEKELEIFLKVISFLKKDFPNIRVAIAGKGPEKSNIEQKIIELSLGSNVKLIGYVEEIVDFYNSGKLFMITSSTEGLPRTVIEAMSCGIPCIASNVGDMQDVIDNNTNGFLVDDYSKIENYAKHVKILLSNNEKYTEFSDNSVCKIHQNFSYKAATDVWEEIIRKIRS